MEDLDARAIDVIRGLAMDAPRQANSGHPGTAMALAPLAHVLFSRILRHDPAEPRWPDRDRFVLSCGHASILLYSMLFLSGYGLEVDDLRSFRQFGSRTPGHPEVLHTTGVEVTTGPLGQGFGNAVGMAIAERYLRARFGADVMDHHTFVLASDGDLMEGISHEAASLAGHLGLGHLVVVFDDNHITIDGNTDLAVSDDYVGRFEAYGWHTEYLGEIANDLDALEAAVRRAMAVEDRPSMLVLRSHIGYPSPTFTDDPKAHGDPFPPEEISRTKALMGLPPEETFYTPTDVVTAYRELMARRGAAARTDWQRRFDAWSGDRAEWESCWSGQPLAGWEAKLPTFASGEKLATRQAIQRTINATLEFLPGLLSGSGDLTGNTGTKLDGAMNQSKEHPEGRQIHFGIREHAMGSTMNGMALHGGVLPVGGTFFVFSDYLRPTLRLASMSRAKDVFIFTHDSVGLGEDGPTHQPIEHLASIRAIPGLQVIRPADANETAAAWRVAITHHGPTALVLTRQAVPVVTDGSAVEPGAATVLDADDPQLILIGTGSEVAVAIDAAARLTDQHHLRVRVVSMPSWDRFSAQPAAARAEVLPAGVPTLAVEAATTFGWERWADAAVGIDRFGASAPGATALAELGINPDHVVARALELLAEEA